MIRALFLLAALLCSAPAWAIADPSEALPDAKQEARSVAVGSQLRCLVCQNESIEDSGADLARDLRKIVREHVAAGETDEQITAWMVARYGDFVRLRPPVNLATSLLWASPVVALLIAGGLAMGLRRRAAAPPPLSADEQKRLAQLLEG
jgi:cytochrome c-type biogenesis protein CcmH